ncbi:trypsin-like serine peptidase [Aquimarina intermedia]|uniref:Serine protease n=1 Tax=Aquimarina intermedia TaxID=350814 RepID=A0A5S5BZD6_9FLAO|nr:serine protease [Aquimarina intermedia]TYP71430.1 V8-like Glu-specific endopeptidase [Aquimarina intermedia]
MKSNGTTHSAVYDEAVYEESYDGVENFSDDAYSDIQTDENEEASATDYQEVSNESDTIHTEDVDSEDSFEGGDTSDNEEATLEATQSNETLEQISGYDYSVTELEQENDQTLQDTKPLDAYYASYGDPDMVALMRTESGQKMLEEVVIGKDDRKRITQTKKYPWRTICSLRITAKDGTNWIGTGFLIGPRTVITAGHVVYMHNHGGWAKKIEVIPGRNGSSKPFGSCTSSHLHSVKGWTKSKKRIMDYGAIILPKNCKYGKQLGYFGYANYSFASLLGLKVNLSGYPGDKPSGTQWWHCRKIKFVTPRTLVYNIDSAGGQSGSPVWKYKNGKRYVVGIHTNGSSLGNSATRITSPVFKNLKNWKNKYK